MADNKILYSVRITPEQREALRHFLSWHPGWDVEEVDIEERGEHNAQVPVQVHEEARNENLVAEQVAPAQDVAPEIAPVVGEDECPHCFASHV